MQNRKYRHTVLMKCFPPFHDDSVGSIASFPDEVLKIDLEPSFEADSTSGNCLWRVIYFY